MKLGMNLICAVVASVWISGAVLADEASDIEKVRAELAKVMPAAGAADIQASPVEGVFQIELNNSFAFAYVSGDYVLMGDLYNTKDQVNVGDQASNARMATLIQDVPLEDMIVFGPEEPERYMTVFTDIDCGYCRKLHAEIDELTQAGIQVRYIAYPRAGLGSNSFNKYVSVWCNDDQQSSLTTAKAGGDVPDAECDNPIARNYTAGRTVGIRGTPTIIFDDGTVTPGYQPSATILARLGLE